MSLTFSNTHVGDKIVNENILSPTPIYYRQRHLDRFTTIFIWWFRLVTWRHADHVMTISDSGETDAKGRKRYDRNAPKTMPPKYQKTTKDFEVFGFHSRQRRAYVNLCMRYGLPPKENFQDRWIVRELSRKVNCNFVATRTARWLNFEGHSQNDFPCLLGRWNWKFRENFFFQVIVLTLAIYQSQRLRTC